jgi:hypothetical protein
MGLLDEAEKIAGAVAAVEGVKSWMRTRPS